MAAAGTEIKTSTTHVEAAIRGYLGTGVQFPPPPIKMLAQRASIFIALSEVAAATESNGLLLFPHLRPQIRYSFFNQMPFQVYILRCSDNSLYVGYAEDVIARVALHRAGRGAAHTADPSSRPTRLSGGPRNRTRRDEAGTSNQLLDQRKEARPDTAIGHALNSLAKRRVF